jgi:hypothetical protein
MKHSFVSELEQRGRRRGGGGNVFTVSEINVLRKSQAVELGYNVIKRNEYCVSL